MMQSALLLFALAAPAAAVFRPYSKGELIAGVNLCLDDDRGGDCYALAATTVPNARWAHVSDRTYGPIGTWDVSKITNMYRVFKDKTFFDQDLSDWDVSSVTSFKQMFWNAQSFNNGDNTGNGGQGINGWQFKPGTQIDFQQMFFNADAFTRSINDWNFDHTNVILTHMFQNTPTPQPKLCGESWYNQNPVTEYYDCKAGCEANQGYDESLDYKCYACPGGYSSPGLLFVPWDVDAVDCDIDIDSLNRLAQSDAGRAAMKSAYAAHCPAGQ